jgi:NTE family protein
VNRKVHSSEKFSTAIDTYVRSTTIGLFHIEQRLLREADVVILPRVGNLHWTDFGRATELILEGERAAREKLPDIRKVFHSPIRRVPSELFKRIFKRC